MTAAIWLAVHEDESGRGAAHGHDWWARPGWIMGTRHVPAHRVAFEAGPSKEWHEWLASGNGGGPRGQALQRG